MPLPNTIQGTDTFNTWLDATNNVIVHIANTSVYVLVNNTATGNVSVTGQVTTATLLANANVVLGATTLGAATPVFKLTTNSSNSNTIAILGTNLTIAMTNTVMSGTFLSIGQNTTMVGILTVTGNTILSNTLVVTGNTALSNTLIVTGNTVLSNTLDVTGTSTLTGAATLSNTLAVTGAVTLSSTLGVTGATTLTGNAAFSSNAIFSAGVTLGGPVDWKNSFVVNSASALSGAGVASPLAVDANTTVFRLASSVADKVVAGIQQANTSQYRQLVLFNISNYGVYFQHANTAANANSVLCPGNTNFHIPTHGTALLYYDANTSVQKWRVISAPISETFVAVIANTTANGYVSTTTQSFAGAKTFAAAVTASSTLGVTGATTLSSTLGVTGATTLSSTVGVTGAATLSNTLAVTGATTLSSTVGVTGAATLSSTLGVTGAATLSSTLGVTGVTTLSNTTKLQQVFEVTTTAATAATGTIHHDVLTQAVVYYTTNASGNWTLNMRGNSTASLNSTLDTGRSCTIVFAVKQGSTAYYPTTHTIDGNSVTPKWQSIAPTGGNINGTDIYSYTVVKTGDSTFTVFASQVPFV